MLKTLNLADNEFAWNQPLRVHAASTVGRHLPAIEALDLRGNPFYRTLRHDQETGTPQVGHHRDYVELRTMFAGQASTLQTFDDHPLANVDQGGASADPGEEVTTHIDSMLHAHHGVHDSEQTLASVGSPTPPHAAPSAVVLNFVHRTDIPSGCLLYTSPSPRDS